MASLAAEFPNDNPDLHEGVIWVCLDVTGAPRAERHVVVQAEPVPEPEPLPEPEPESIAEPEPIAVAEEPPPARASGIFMIADAPFEIELEADDDIVVEEMTPFEDEAIEVVGSEPPRSSETASETLLEPVVEAVVVAEVAEAPAPAASDDPFMIFVNALVDVALAQGSAFVASQLPALLLDGTVVPGVDVDASALKTAHAWQGILRGTSEDWDAIGGAMLDDFAAELLARLLGASDRTQLIKRELRARGIAGFGLAA